MSLNIGKKTHKDQVVHLITRKDHLITTITSQHGFSFSFFKKMHGQYRMASVYIFYEKTRSCLERLYHQRILFSYEDEDTSLYRSAYNKRNLAYHQQRNDHRLL